MATSKNIEKGLYGENVAIDYLLQKGYTILEKNWRHKHWEIDIIALHKNTLHFVEVKTRTNKKYGNPEESISQGKMNALKKGIEEYLIIHPQWQFIQIDVIAITLENTIVKEIFFIEDVFF